MSIESVQKECCDHYQAIYSPVEPTQLVTISKGIYEGSIPVEGVRYPSPNHMSGWWLTTDEYDGNISSLVTVHFEHINEKCPELAIYMALPFGYRFNLGGETEHVWFDKEVANESI
ncbi:hypothetical protein Q4596_19650 [Pseudoalteromonas carrageenovora]|uniref:immunity protein Imm33 domain-containing protein n=1 Tax=Pseudoalteromonas carrageenovora TaxID=227 RepID=UPI0026E44CC4|nr:hypothetical protein [Pseudoalteromonas carrageenovora]MDO6837835.1 hypothetical protein [Pseudoalteromonas carrageenovora]